MLKYNESIDLYNEIIRIYTKYEGRAKVIKRIVRY